MPNVYEIFTLVANAQAQISGMVRRAKVKGRGMKPQAIADAIGMKHAMFYKRWTESSWTPEQMQKIALLLEPETALISDTIGGAEGN